MKILVIEADADIASNIGQYFEDKGHQLDFAYSGNHGLQLALRERFDLIILDLMLPGKDGITVCREFRAQAKRDTPILMLTARDTVDDTISGFEAGADDYLVKPFSLRELEVRVLALTRRSQGKQQARIMRIDNLELNSDTMQVSRRGNLWVGKFRCMASPCEVLVECDEASQARELIGIAQREALRIEQKFSRYRDDNIVHRINSGGASIAVDDETARLLDFAQNCYDMSDGWFDITSGILRHAWTFGADARLPEQAQIDRLLPHIGWQKIIWEKPRLSVPGQMEIDFGGIGKEYAVDAALGLLTRATEHSVMVNFGGDCSASGPMADGSPWMTGIENPHRPGDATAVIQLRAGALATSGDVFKYIEQDGVRYGHILNPRTGWPNTESPLSVTVAAATCTEAGIMSTLAMLQGEDAESFLDRQGVKYWCYR